MADRITPKLRSEIMRRVRSKNTAPEMIVRRSAHALGYRFKLHQNQLPGSPDIVFPSRRKIVFVHGCFWHGHTCARGNRLPSTNTEYWSAKFNSNKKRDQRNQSLLQELGWSVLTIWECETRFPEVVEQELEKFLSPK